VPEHEQDTLWEHTLAIRNQREAQTVLAIEEKKKGGDSRRDDDFEFVRKQEKESPYHRVLRSAPATWASRKPRISKSSKMANKVDSDSDSDSDVTQAQRDRLSDRENNLLPQDEAERLMDEFLATFTEGGD
jgi:hypothetical protein